MALLPETPDAIDPALTKDIESLLQTRFKRFLEPDEAIRINASTGNRAAHVEARVGTLDEAHVFELFAENIEGEQLEGALGLLIDYLDGVLKEFFVSEKDAYFPLDFSPRTFAKQTLYARHTFRRFALEEEANRLLSKS